MQWLLACFVLLQPAEVKYSEPVWQMDMVMPGRLEGWGVAYGFDRFYVGTNVSRVWDDGKGKFYVEAGAYSLIPNLYKFTYATVYFFQPLPLVASLLYEFIFLTPYVKVTYDAGPIGTIGAYWSWSEDHVLMWGRWWNRSLYTWLHYRYTWTEGTLPVVDINYAYGGEWFHALDMGMLIVGPSSSYWRVSMRYVHGWRDVELSDTLPGWFVAPKLGVGVVVEESSTIEFEMILGIVWKTGRRFEDGSTEEKREILSVFQMPMLQPMYLIGGHWGVPFPNIMYTHRW